MSTPASVPTPHRVPRRTLVVAITFAAVVAGACSPAAPGTPASSAAPSFSPIPPGEASGAPSLAPSPTPNASDVAASPGLLLEVTNEGGFINPAASIGALPTVVVDADGRIYTPGLGDYASFLIPSVAVRDTGAVGAAAILAALTAAGLDKEGAGGGVAADTGSTVFTAMIGGTTVVNRVSGGMGGPGVPGVHPGASGGPGASAAPGVAALALLARLTDPAETWGAATAPVATVYVPAGYRVWLAPAAPDSAGPTAVAWPLAGDPAAFGAPVAADFGVTGLRSGVLTGADAATLAKALATTPSGTLLASSSKAKFQAWIRPLFPDELGS